MDGPRRLLSWDMALRPILQMEKQRPKDLGTATAGWRQSQVLCTCQGLPRICLGNGGVRASWRSRTVSCGGVSSICPVGPPPRKSLSVPLDPGLAVLVDSAHVRPCTGPGVSDKDVPAEVMSVAISPVLARSQEKAFFLLWWHLGHQELLEESKVFGHKVRWWVLIGSGAAAPCSSVEWTGLDRRKPGSRARAWGCHMGRQPRGC